MTQISTQGCEAEPSTLVSFPPYKGPAGAMVRGGAEHIKKEMKLHKYMSAEWRRLNAKPLSVKKVVNTLYGVFASIYFSISSPCIANNVTDRARSAC